MRKIFFVLFFVFFSQVAYAGNGKYSPVKKGEIAKFDGILIDIRTASTIITSIK
jgi:hypothetical protein